MNSSWLYFRFCKEHDDEELWDMLVDYAVHKPKLIYQLLTSIGTHVHPKILIEKIELGLEIPHLKKALAIIMQDYRLQVTLQVQFDPPKMVLIKREFILILGISI